MRSEKVPGGLRGELTARRSRPRRRVPPGGRRPPEPAMKPVPTTGPLAERHHYVANTRWWPPFCLVVDWVAAAILVVLIATGIHFH
jgi:hypothetical protein